jgi:DNA invertase Pin-like site-specific DNA recombinase
MTVIGYPRVSTTDQDLSIQEAALKAAGCQVIRAEKRSGTTTEGREALRTVQRGADHAQAELVQVRR